VVFPMDLYNVIEDKPYDRIGFCFVIKTIDQQLNVFSL
jgi:hypothetical protein